MMVPLLCGVSMRSYGLRGCSNQHKTTRAPKPPFLLVFCVC